MIIRKGFLLPEEVLSKLDFIKNKRNIKNNTEAVIYCIIETHGKENIK